MKKQSASWIKKQADLVIKHQRYAVFLVALLTVLPLTAEIALALMALVTLKKGFTDGVKLLLVAIVSSLAVVLLQGVALSFYFMLVLGACLVFISAVVLRETSSWALVLAMLVLILCLGLGLIHVFAADWADAQLSLLLEVLQGIDPGAHLAKSLQAQQGDAKPKLAAYLLGMRAAAVAGSVCSSLMMARAMQAALFNPGGFLGELRNIRAHPLMALMVMVCALGAYQGQLFLLSCFPVLFAYELAAGLSLMFALLNKTRKLFVWVLMGAPIIVLPYITLPAYAILGILDSFIHLRHRRYRLAHSQSE